MGMYAAVAKRRIGELQTDDEGRKRQQQADAWMTAQQIKNPSA